MMSHWDRNIFRYNVRMITMLILRGNDMKCFSVATYSTQNQKYIYMYIMFFLKKMRHIFTIANIVS